MENTVCMCTLFRPDVSFNPLDSLVQAVSAKINWKLEILKNIFQPNSPFNRSPPRYTYWFIVSYFFSNSKIYYHVFSKLSKNCKEFPFKVRAWKFKRFKKKKCSIFSKILIKIIIPFNGTPFKNLLFWEMYCSRNVLL